LHIWSLSIEEQFYLLLPGALYLIGKRYRLFSLALIFAMSLSLAEYLVCKDPSSTYFSFFGRIFEFIPGVAVAVLRAPSADKNNEWTFSIASIISMVCILYCAVTFNQFTPFPSLYATIPVLCAAIIIYLNAPQSILYRALSTKPCLHIGQLSYCLYLWHWPVFVVMEKAGYGSTYLLTIGMLVSYGLALATSIFIENPIRKMKIPAKKAIFIFTVTPFLAGLLLVAIGKNSNDFQFLYSKQTQKISQTGANTIWEDKRTEKCWAQTEFKLDQSCMIGELGSNTLGVLWGDSHAYHLVDFADLLGKYMHLKLIDHAYSLCPPVMQMPGGSPDPVIAEHDRSCNIHNMNTVNAILHNDKIRYVLISATWITYAETVDTGKNALGFANGEFKKKLVDTINILNQAGKRIVILNDIPHLNSQMIDCTLKNSLVMSRKKECSYSVAELNKNQLNFNLFLQNTFKNNQYVFIVDTFTALCEKGRCDTEYKQLPLYKNADYGHLNRYGSQLLFYFMMKRNRANLNALNGFIHGLKDVTQTEQTIH